VYAGLDPDDPATAHRTLAEITERARCRQQFPGLSWWDGQRARRGLCFLSAAALLRQSCAAVRLQLDAYRVVRVAAVSAGEENVN
jgi:hypothetical protein